MPIPSGSTGQVGAAGVYLAFTGKNATTADHAASTHAAVISLLQPSGPVHMACSTRCLAGAAHPGLRHGPCALQATRPRPIAHRRALHVHASPTTPHRTCSPECPQVKAPPHALQTRLTLSLLCRRNARPQVPSGTAVHGRCARSKEAAQAQGPRHPAHTAGVRIPRMGQG